MISKKKRMLLIAFVDSFCEHCNKKFDESKLEIHRLHRGIMGGNYKDFRNLKVLCKDCHRLYHYGEFRR